jgi:hypothetical protein
MQYILLGEDGPREQCGDRLHKAVGAFCALLADSVPAPEVVLLYDWDWTRQQWLDYRKQTGYHRRRGVYAHFSVTGECLYVGKGSSEKQRLDRCWGYRGDECQWILAASVPDDIPYLVPALEQFLIERLNPRDNCIRC